LGRRSIALGLLAVWLVASNAAAQQTALGHPVRAEDVQAIDIDVLPDGRGLPPGSGTAELGRSVYAARCAACHGPTGTEGPSDVLAGGQGSLATPRPIKTVGSYWPYATTLWDYVRRAMPFAQPRSLSVNDTYAVTAYVLYLNGIVGERDVMSETTLPRVRMPNADGFVPDPRPDVPSPQLPSSSSPKP
jgi:cytochrome c